MKNNLLTGTTSWIAGLSFLVGMIVYVALLSYVSYGDTAQAVLPQLEFIASYSTLLYVWYFVIYILFGLALIGFQISIKTHLVTDFFRSFALILGYLWAGITIVTGMLANVGTHMILELMGQHQELAISQWYNLQMLINGMGGGNEIVGGLWLIAMGLSLNIHCSLTPLLRSIALVFGCVGVLTAAPMLEYLGGIFGVGCMLWFFVMGSYKLVKYKREIAYA